MVCCVVCVVVLSFGVCYINLLGGVFVLLRVCLSLPLLGRVCLRLLLCCVFAVVGAVYCVRRSTYGCSFGCDFVVVWLTYDSWLVVVSLLFGGYVVFVVVCLVV